MAIGDVISFSVIGEFLGQTHANVWHYTTTAEVGGGLSLAEFCNHWDTNLKPGYLALLSTSYTALVYEAKRIFPTPSDPTQVGVPAPTAGDVAGETLPSYVSIVTALRTGIPTRSKRGRFYLGGQVEANVAGNAYDATYRAAVQAYATGLVAPIVATVAGRSETFALTIWSRELGSGTVVTEALTSGRPATTRSRKFRGLVGA